jgi:hypothetical protein
MSIIATILKAEETETRFAWAIESAAANKIDKNLFREDKLIRHNYYLQK